MRTSGIVGRLVLPGVLAVIFVTGALFYASLERVARAGDSLNQTLRMRQLLSDVQSVLVDAETGQRGFLLTSDQRYLAPYFRSYPLVEERIASLREESIDAPARMQIITEIEGFSRDKLAELSETIEAHSRGGLQQSLPMLIDDSGRRLMDEIRRRITVLTSGINQELEVRQAAYQQGKIALVISVVVFMAIGLLLLAAVYLFMRREIVARNLTMEQGARYAETLDRNIKMLERERNEITRLNENSNFLQSCNSLQEIGALAGPQMESLFPNLAGAIWSYAASRNQLVRLANWGGSGERDHFAPDECWALRRGRSHVFEANGSAPRCGHLDHDDVERTLCLPLVAHGEALGLMTLALPKGRPQPEHAPTQLAEMVATQLGLTLGNLRLRESLNEQSIRDPLTGTFNRRYLDVVAEKEVALARRFGRSFAVVMLDIDHFKRFNDLHGHLAGDAALTAVSDYLRRKMREDDWLFRYGGEEFVLLFREASISEAEAIAQDLREGIAALSLSLEAKALPSVTASMGIAAYPEHGETMELLLARADDALYASKRAGRNRITSAEFLAA